jgi:hypothetical protein
MTTKTLGQVAFEAWCKNVEGETWDGPHPAWTGKTTLLKSDWESAAQAVAAAVRAETEEVVQAAEAFYEADAKWQRSTSSEYEDAEQERGRCLDSMLAAITALRARREVKP